MKNHLFFTVQSFIMLLFSIAFLNAMPAKVTTDFSLKRESVVDSSMCLTNKSVLAFCTPSSTNSNHYINEVKFLGTLNQDVINPSAFSSLGYRDYTALSSKARQVPGGVVNVNVSFGSAQGIVLGTTKAWVDWNKDEIFDQTPSEKVYDMSVLGFQSGNVIFGFVVPLGTPSGFYRIRIRTSSSSTSFTACNSISRGEAEDYTFEVVQPCAATITSVSATKRCGLGSVVLSVTGSSNTTSYKWYASEFGAAIANQNVSSYTTASLPIGTYTYYVTASNGVCDSTFRTPIEVVVNPLPVIQFTQSLPEICGPLNAIVISSSSDKEQVTLLEEHFDNTPQKPVLFENVVAGNAIVDGIWQLRASPYIPATPPYNVLKPAISSGYNGGNFANIITDVRRTDDLLNHFVLKNNLNSTGFTEMKLEFDLYFFSEEDVENRNSLKVQYSIDGGVTWANLKTYIADVGVPSRFQRETIALPAVLENKTQLKLRFSSFAMGSAAEWMADIVALDNIRIFGNKEVPANFIWSANTTLYNSSCTGAPLVGGSPSICIIPTENDIQTKPQFDITVSATLANGCNLSHTLNIANNNKVWDVAETNWATANWQPTNAVPDITKCVLVKKPVTIYNGSHFDAKNVKVLPGGEIAIKNNASLKIKDALINEAAAAAIIIEPGGNLLQINEEPNINFGAITAKKNIKISVPRKQYNYLISPLEGQSLKTIYPGISRIIYYNEANNFFYTSSGDYVKGQGLAVKEPVISTEVPVESLLVNATFVGKPTNGAFDFTIKNSAPLETIPTDNDRGFNLIGNPYPSSIDLVKLYEINGGQNGKLSATFYFWDNAVNDIYTQQGVNYGGQSYGLYNAFNGTQTPATGDVAGNPMMPSRYVVSGTGFMARALLPALNLKFENYIRTNQPIVGGALMKDDKEGSVDRYWLSLISPSNMASTMAVVYFSGGKAEVGEDDSFSLMGSDAVYSVINDQNLSINGKSVFAQNDVVALGTSHFQTGDYTLKIVDKEGVFAAGQNIYLKDKQTGIITNLTESHYVFSASAGMNTNRFEIIYEPETTLATNGEMKDDVVVYKEGSELVVKATSKKITYLEVYDALGRMILQKSGNQKEIRLNSHQISTGMYIFKIYQGENVTTKKIIR